ncbi:MAG: PD40 domain-containing protein [Chloroflexi bacterium]|nr:PD40 domain-containing protein [Chloroflexota bacterium]
MEERSYTAFATPYLLRALLAANGWGLVIVLLVIWLGHAKPPPREMLYMSDRDGDWDIYSLDADLGLSLRLTYDPLFNFPNTLIFNRYPAWSPDGSLIAFHANPLGNYDLYIMNADGTNLHQLTDSPADDAMASWSPDGTRLVFHSQRTGNWDIWTLNVQTGAQQQVTFYAGDDNFPVWSPDGRSLLFVSDRRGTQEIYVRSALTDAPPEALNGYSLRQLTNNNRDEWTPVWSPDGRYIAYSAEEPSGQEIFVMHADGSNTRRLYSTISEEWNPAWLMTPDGLALTFVSTLDGTVQIYLLDFDDFDRGYGPANRITVPRDPDAEQWAPDWRPR